MTAQDAEAAPPEGIGEDRRPLLKTTFLMVADLPETDWLRNTNCAW